jgi:succinyl-diaminopimelate desuccinylase
MTGPAIEVDAEGVVAFTQELVRLRTVHEPATGTAEAPAAALVAAKMREFGWRPSVVEVAPGRPNVIAVIDGGGGPGPTLAFEGHTDVVTEGALDDWTVDPFGAVIENGRLYGRGSADMKSGVAAMLFGVRALELAGPFPGRVKVCALVDEEGMMLGAKHLVSSGEADDIDAAVICEPEAGEICTTAKGAIRLRIELRGKMAHGAMPQHGRNPIVPAAQVVLALHELQAQLQRSHPPHPHLGDVYVTPTVALAGSTDQINVIPGTCTVCVDVRTVPGVDHESVVEQIAGAAVLAAGDSGVTVRVTVVDDRPPVEIPADSPVVVALAGAHEAVYGEPARYGGVPGATDGTILTRDTGMPTVVYGPGGKWIAHQADEFVEVEEIVRAARVYAETARRYLTRGAT